MLRFYKVQTQIFPVISQKCLPKDSCHSQISTMSRITCSHHIFGIKHLECTNRLLNMINIHDRHPLIIWYMIRYMLLHIYNHTCWVSSGTVRHLYSWFERDVKGANPGIKKWSRGKGTILTASFLKSALSWPGKRRQVVTPDIVAETKWFKSLKIIE